MTEKQLREAQIISNGISNLKYTNNRLSEVLVDNIDDYRISISIERSNPHFSMSLGGQKFDFKEEIIPLLQSVYDKNLIEIEKLENQFKEL
jgi:hypothetical protein